MWPADWSDWFWNTALDGIVGAVLGAAVAGFVAALVLGRTIKHEQASAAEDVLRVEIERLQERAAGLRDELMRGDPHFGLAMFSWIHELTTLTQARSESDPVFAEIVNAVALRVGDASSGKATAEGQLVVEDLPAAIAGLANVEKLLRRRVLSPEYFKMSASAKDDLIEKLRTDWTI